jgi:hypothetical protein
MYKKKKKEKNKTDVRSALGRNGLYGLAGFYSPHLPFLSMTCVTHLALFLFFPGDPSAHSSPSLSLSPVHCPTRHVRIFCILALKQK